MRNRTHLRRLVLIAVALMVGTSCSSNTAAESVDSVDSFWSELSSVTFMEVDPPVSTDNLVEKSTLIIRGTILESRAWEDEPFYDESVDYTVRFPLTTLQVQVSEVIYGEQTEERIDIILAGANEDAKSAGTNTKVPKSDHLFFLTPANRADSPGAYVLASDLGAWALNDQGVLSTVRDPGLRDNVIPKDVSDLDSAITLLRAGR